MSEFARCIPHGEIACLDCLRAGRPPTTPIAARKTPMQLFGEPTVWTTEIYRKRTTFLMLEVKPHLFRVDYAEWLLENYELWLYFEDETLRMIARRFKHGGARLIWNKIRFETALRQGPDKDGRMSFKINNNYSPDCARLFHLLHPEHDGFFELRGRTAAQSALPAA